MKPPLDGTVLITGASSGIGREFARQLAGRAKKLILVARREDRLRELAGELRGSEIVVAPCDVTDRAAVDRILTDDIDVLINCAGFGDLGLFESASWEKTEALLRVNVLATTYLVHRVLGPMLRRGRGGILNVSSGFGLTFMPGMATYIGSKHFVTAFTESLRIELAGTGVVVSQLCPGPVETEFQSVMGNPIGHDIPKFLMIDPARCARSGLKGFERGRAIVIPGFVGWLLITMGRLSPRWVLRLLYSWIGGWMRKRK